MITIKPTSLGVLGTAEQLQVTVHGFTTDATTTGTYWALKTAEGKQIAEGNYNLTEDEFEAWGADNSYIEEIILSQLNLEKA
jgi:predicted secreted protein